LIPVWWAIFTQGTEHLSIYINFVSINVFFTSHLITKVMYNCNKTFPVALSLYISMLPYFHGIKQSIRKSDGLRPKTASKCIVLEHANTVLLSNKIRYYYEKKWKEHKTTGVQEHGKKNPEANKCETITIYNNLRLMMWLCGVKYLTPHLWQSVCTLNI
jgi:hypothetical protein